MVKVRIKHLENAVPKHFNVISAALVDAFMSPVRCISHRPNQKGVLAFINMGTVLDILLFNAKVNEVYLAFMDSEVHGLDVSMDKIDLMKLLDCLQHLDGKP